MSTKEVLGHGLKLNPEARFMLVEGLIENLDEPDKDIDAIGAGETERQLKTCREGKLDRFV